MKKIVLYGLLRILRNRGMIISFIFVPLLLHEIQSIMFKQYTPQTIFMSICLTVSYLSGYMVTYLVKDKMLGIDKRVQSITKNQRGTQMGLMILFFIGILFLFTICIGVTRMAFKEWAYDNYSIIIKAVLFYTIFLSLFNLMVYNLCSNGKQSSVMVILTILPMVLLSGAFIPVEIFPKMFKNINQYLPLGIVYRMIKSTVRF